MTTNRAAIYCRISQDREGAGLGVKRQRADCEKLADAMGLTVAAIHTDNDISAYSGKPRPGYRALLDDISAKRVDVVIVWHTDRLHRSPSELEEYITLCEQRNVTTQTVQAGELDLATPSGRAVARTLGAWARYEVDHKSKRIKAAQLQKVKAGGWIGGARPLGWDIRPDGSATLNRKAANRIRKAATDVLAGVSLGSIVNDWNAQGFTTGTGKRWNYTSLRQVLTRARNAGWIEYNGELAGKADWPAILSEDTWRSLCALLADPGRRRSHSNRAKWLLSGIAVCGKQGCGARLKSATVGSNAKGETKRTVYRCTEPGRGHVARSVVDVDKLVRDLVAEWLAHADLAALVQPARDQGAVAEMQAEAVALRARLDEAAESFADGAITGGQLATITERVSRRLAEVDEGLSVSARGSALDGLVNAKDRRKAWHDLKIERQRAVVAELLTITIMPGLRGREFDPELICYEWRYGAAT